MHWPGMTFLALLAARAAIQLWLARRQIVAVQRHRSTVPRAFASQISVADQKKAADYAAARLRVALAADLIQGAGLLALTFGGGIGAIDAAWRATALQDPWLGTAVVLSTVASLHAAALPLAAWRTFRLEARFGFNRTSARLFGADLAKRLGIAFIAATPIIAAVLTLMLHGGPWWWAAAWLGWLGVMLAWTWAWPRIVAPLFSRFTPLADATLEARIARLLERCGFASSGVFVMDGSRRSAHGNAYFTGIGRHKHIVFSDTLLNSLDPAEIEAVLAHELGHFRLRHIHRRLIAGAALALAGFALLALAMDHAELQHALGVQDAGPGVALAMYLLATPVVTFFLRPLAAWRSRRDERQADDFALRHTSPEQLAAALVKIYRTNAASLTSDPLYSAFYDTHPAPATRVARLHRASPVVNAEANPHWA